MSKMWWVVTQIIEKMVTKINDKFEVFKKEKTSTTDIEKFTDINETHDCT